jgi:hypothetical protein
VAAEAAAAVAAGRLRLAALPGLFAASAALGVGAAPSAFDLAGRYSYSFDNGDVDGDHYRSTDELEIVARDRTHAVFDINLNFFNGHECALNGEAVLEEDVLVFREAQPAAPGEPACVLRLWRDGTRIRWTDGEGSCQAYCGARGSFRSGHMAWSSRRPISRAERARFLGSEARSHAGR